MVKNIFCNNSYKIGNLTLDKDQTRVVKEKAKCYLVVAGAGSGKTLTIVARIKYLIEEKHVSPKDILCISFTNETVDSLKRSLEKYNFKVDVKTFHKLSLYLINDSKISLSASNFLEYVAQEYFYSYLYFDDTYKLLLSYLEDKSLEFDKFISNFIKVAVSFIHTLKAYNYDFSYFYFLLFSKKVLNDDKILLILIFKIYVIYSSELIAENKIDLDDIINLAITKVDSMKKFKYKYLIIDEYQDTSNSKYLLIKKLVNKFSINLMAVGDDFQSIYSFSGCDLVLFLKFKSLFAQSKILKIKNNYRCPKDIVDISRRFILKNKNQVRKRLKSKKYISRPIVIVYSNNVSEDILKIIKKLDNIMILVRNNKDIDLMVDNINLKKEDKRIIYLDEAKDIRWFTVHAAKGLESDYVIVLNLIDDYLGFPNKIEDYDIFKYIKKKSDKFLYAEERRLFYVALTRARKKVFLFTNKENPSVFIKELLDCYKWKIKIIDFE